MLGGLWGGIVFCALYVWQTIKHGVPSLLMLAWPALFLSLGWNFLEYGLDPPGDESGLVWGWLICAILFILMGGIPLIATIKPMMRNFTDDEPPPGFKTVVTEPVRTLRNFRVPTSTKSSARTSDDDLVGELERLARLHRSGDLGDDEYASAKRRLLEDR